MDGTQVTEGTEATDGTQVTEGTDNAEVVPVETPFQETQRLEPLRIIRCADGKRPRGRPAKAKSTAAKPKAKTRARTSKAASAALTAAPASWDTSNMSDTDGSHADA